MGDVAGLVDLSLKLADQGVPIAWVYPEAGLHPGAQTGLADVAIWMKNNYTPEQKEN